MKYYFAITISLIFSSCLTSLHPVTTAKNITTDDRVVGNWVGNDEDTVHILRFTESNSYKSVLGEVRGRQMNIKIDQPSGADSVLYARGYNIVFQKDGVVYSMFGGITRIGDQLFVDLIPLFSDDPKHAENSGFEYGLEYLTAFTMAKLEIVNNNQLNLHFLNGDFIKEQINNGNIHINHESDNLFENLLITASTEQLHQFLRKYGNDQRLFSKENSVTLIRKG
jgi:hypothetical protein